LSLLAQQERLITLDMLVAALRIRFKGKTLDGVIALVQKAQKLGNR